jgi:hypothetical protein
MLDRSTAIFTRIALLLLLLLMMLLGDDELCQWIGAIKSVFTASQ